MSRIMKRRNTIGFSRGEREDKIHEAVCCAY
jgi:hypothetical protein